MKNILIISHDKVGTQMAGPGIRYHYMSEVLSEHFNVTLGFFGPENVPDDAFRHSYDVQHIDVHHFEEAFSKADAVIALWLSDAQIDYCNSHQKLVIFDIYAPVPVENLAVDVFSGKHVGDANDFRAMSEINDYRKFLENGDKAKVTVRFRGRELAHPELGMQLLDKMVKELGELVVVEQNPKFEGRQIVMVLAPKKK